MLFKAVISQPTPSTFGYCYTKCRELWPKAVAVVRNMRYTRLTLPIQAGERLIVYSEPGSASFASFSFQRDQLVMWFEGCDDLRERISSLPLWRETFGQYVEEQPKIGADDDEPLFSDGW